MQGLDIVKVIWYGPHFDHALPIVGCEALDLRAPEIRNQCYCPFIRDKDPTYLFWNQTCTCRGLKPGISLESRSLCAASGCGCFANSLIRNRVCWWVSLYLVSPVPDIALSSRCLPEPLHLPPRCGSFGRRHLLQCRFRITVDHVILIYHIVVVLLLGHLVLMTRLAGWQFRALSSRGD